MCYLKNRHTLELYNKQKLDFLRQGFILCLENRDQTWAISFAWSCSTCCLRAFCLLLKDIDSSLTNSAKTRGSMFLARMCISFQSPTSKCLVSSSILLSCLLMVINLSAQSQPELVVASFYTQYTVRPYLWRHLDLMCILVRLGVTIRMMW